ncbi:hypothetical protein [Anaeromicropila populeti]|uniref:Uncharacterized protein n=1 Tax=Anaeromicropila populeti TaxID=37658 RepID=A0A1I6IDM8_9FIRM|nr:hypothetical protein [Anaeromicropila populeti]SFR64796.1 hypothetical protein SAMN05661086_00731 [Anaeromicropila populeti]
MNLSDNRKIVKLVKESYEPLVPKNKPDFLKKAEYPKLSFKEFFIGQIQYIRLRTWLVSILLFVSALFIIELSSFYNMNVSAIKAASAFVPFFVLAAVAETARSKQYGMKELEMTCRFSFGTLLLVKMILLGILNLLLLSGCSIFLRFQTDIKLFRIGIYLLVPFLLTCNLTLILASLFKSREITYFCGFVCGIVSVSCLFTDALVIDIYSAKYDVYWLLSVGVLMLVLVQKIVQIIKNSGGILWNLSLTG